MNAGGYSLSHVLLTSSIWREQASQINESVDLLYGVTMDCDLTCMPHFRLREHHSEWLGTVQKQYLCFAFFHYRIHQLLQLILRFCNNYCIICIPKVVDHMPPILIPSISSMFISVYKTNRCGDATHPCQTPCLILNDSLISQLCLTAACWFQYRFASSLTSCGSMSRDCSNSIIGRASPCQTLCCNQWNKHTHLSAIILSTNLLNIKIAFLVPLSGMKPYCTSDISLSVRPLILFIITLRTSFVTWLIKLIVLYVWIKTFGFDLMIWFD